MPKKYVCRNPESSAAYMASRTDFSREKHRMTTQPDQSAATIRPAAEIAPLLSRVEDGLAMEISRRAAELTGIVSIDFVQDIGA